MAKSHTIAEEGPYRRRPVGSGAGTEDSLKAGGEPAQGDEKRTGQILAVGAAALAVVWVLVNFVAEQAAIVVLSRQAHVGLSQQAPWWTVALFAELISALVLFLLAADRERQGLRWVAAGFVIYALGQQAFNSLLTPLLGVAPDLNLALYEKFVIWTVAYALFVAGLLPDAPPRFTWRWAFAVLAGFGALGMITVAVVPDLPLLVDIPRWEAADVIGHAPLPGLTGWHYALYTIPLGLAIVAAVGTVRHDRGRTAGGWLMVAMVLLAGAQLHSIFWPSSHPSVITSTYVLRSALLVTILVGGILELRRIATERSALLATEQERSERLRELAILKADFTAMVAHELGSPLAAIQGYTDMLSSGKLSPDRRARTLDAIRTETDALNALVADVQTAAAVERDDFAVRPGPVALEALLADAAAYARTLPGRHPLVMKSNVREWVLADAERIGQVLRNLLSNAAKYSPGGTPIEIGATLRMGRVRIAVADRGPGIHPDDLPRIFEKFERGRDRNGRKVAGAGLGLYLSRRIVRAHGGEFTVDARPGKGSIFAFELEVAR